MENLYLCIIIEGSVRMSYLINWKTRFRLGIYGLIKAVFLFLWGQTSVELSVLSARFFVCAVMVGVRKNFKVAWCIIWVVEDGEDG